MTKVTFYQNQEGQFTGFTAEGHSGYARAGEDIVCAAVSALVINTVNSIEQLTEDVCAVESDAERGFINFRLLGDCSRESEILLRSLVLGLSEIESDETNQDYVDIIFEEV